MAQPNRILVYADGGARKNPGPAAIAYSIYDEHGIQLAIDSDYIGEATNNEAEYRALLLAMDKACAHCRKEVRFHSDSEFVVRQVNGEYRAKKERMRNFLEQVMSKKSFFEKFVLVHLPRDNPRIMEVDDLVNNTLDREGF